MQYIIIDLEWNQPLSYQSRVYREVGDKLIFEMIQVGAVKLDEERKAPMVSNLLVVLCGNHDAQPVVNSGSLY